jgi:hypothetical protein
VQRKIQSAARFAGTVGSRPRRIVWIAIVVLGLCLGIPALVRARLSASAAPGDASVDGRTAAAPTEINSTPSTAGRPRVTLTSRIELATTILGKTRRAAVVNGRLYREGDTIVAGNEQYRLAGVAEDGVELLALGAGAGQKRSVRLPPAAELQSERDSSGSP